MNAHTPQEWEAIREDAENKLLAWLDRDDPRFWEFHDELVQLIGADSVVFGYALAGFVERVTAYPGRKRSLDNLSSPKPRATDEEIIAVHQKGGTQLDQAKKVNLGGRQYRRRLKSLGLTGRNKKKNRA